MKNDILEKKMKLKEWVLYEALRYQTVPKEAISSGFKSNVYFSRAINSLMSDGLLKEKIYKVRKGTRTWTTRYYLITKKGMSYLCEHSKVEWLNDISEQEILSACTVGSNTASSQMKKNIQIAESAIMSELAGAETAEIRKPRKIEFKKDGAMFVFDDGDFDDDDSDAESKKESGKQQKRFIDIAYESLLRNEKKTQGQERIEYRKNYRPESVAYIRYVDSRQAKELLAPNDMAVEHLRDYDRCAFNGVLDSQFKSVFIFSPYDIGFKWNYWATNVDSRLGTLWAKLNAFRRPEYDPPITVLEKADGAFMIKNRRHFVQVYTDEAKVRSETTKLGSGFRRFYCIPKTSEGVAQLRYLMLTDDDEYNNAIVNNICRGDGYRKNVEWQKDLFPIIDGQDTYIAIGTQLDIRKMQLMEAVKENVKERLRMGIICFAWQAEYYEAIFPDAKIITVTAPEN